MLRVLRQAVSPKRDITAIRRGDGSLVLLRSPVHIANTEARAALGRSDEVGRFSERRLAGGNSWDVCYNLAGI
jgi:hypothetical protein